MGIGKQKAKAKLEKKKLKAKKKSEKAAALLAPEEPTEAKTGRQRHHERVQAKRALRDLLHCKKAERLSIKKSTVDGDEKSLRRALCAEIKMLKVSPCYSSATGIKAHYREFFNDFAGSAGGIPSL